MGSLESGRAEDGEGPRAASKVGGGGNVPAHDALDQRISFKFRGIQAAHTCPDVQPQAALSFKYVTCPQQEAFAPQNRSVLPGVLCTEWAYSLCIRDREEVSEGRRAITR